MAIEDLFCMVPDVLWRAMGRADLRARKLKALHLLLHRNEAALVERGFLRSSPNAE